jgi:hypothetical protein
MSHFRHAAWVPVGLRQVLIVCAALGLVGLALAGCASSAGNAGPASNNISAQSTTRTQQQPAGSGHTTTASSGGAVPMTVRTFTPFDRSGAPTAGVAAHRSGSCFTSSITVTAPGAYRCFAANTIMDPCFRSPASPQHLLECYLTPWARATELRVTKLPAVRPETGITSPWAIELTGSIRCVATNGTPTILHGVGLSYRCPDGWAGLSAAATRAASGAAGVTALYQATDGAVQRLSVLTEWRAGAA